VQLEHVVRTFLRLASLENELTVEVFSDMDSDILNSVASTGRMFNR
jgi:hypothetical protein